MILDAEDQGGKTLAETVSDLVSGVLEVDAIVLSPIPSEEESSTFDNYYIAFKVKFDALYGKSRREIIQYITEDFLRPAAASLALQIDKIGKPIEFYVPPIENGLNSVFTGEQVLIEVCGSETDFSLEVDMRCRKWKCMEWANSL